MPLRLRAPSLFLYDEMRKLRPEKSDKTSVIFVWVPKGRKPINSKISVEESHVGPQSIWEAQEQPWGKERREGYSANGRKMLWQIPRECALLHRS